MDAQGLAFLDVAYRVFTGEEPHAGMHVRDKCIAVMGRFDGRKLNNDERLERAARAALCVVGLQWNEADRWPYDWELIAERVRELTPTLGVAHVDSRLLMNLLAAERQGRTVVSHARR